MKMPGASVETVVKFESLVPDDPRVTVRKVFGHPAAFLNGNMFFGTFGTQIFVRLSSEECAAVCARGDGRPFEPMAGRAMSGYVVLPAPTLASPKVAREWVSRSVKFAASLPPKVPKAGARKRTR